MVAPTGFEPFETEELPIHWHPFWTSADSLHVVLPPLGTGGGRCGPASIEALARVLVADVLADVEPQQDTEDKQ